MLDLFLHLKKTFQNKTHSNSAYLPMCHNSISCFYDVFSDSFSSFDCSGLFVFNLILSFIHDFFMIFFILILIVFFFFILVLVFVCLGWFFLIFIALLNLLFIYFVFFCNFNESCVNDCLEESLEFFVFHYRTIEKI